QRITGFAEGIFEILNFLPGGRIGHHIDFRPAGFLDFAQEFKVKDISLFVKGGDFFIRPVNGIGYLLLVYFRDSYLAGLNPGRRYGAPDF
ncbi:MAG: hypothetical protein R3232_07045, partial [Clostridia bacterium]|nr:hypothetical protein [Clostridia bacterium]